MLQFSLAGALQSDTGPDSGSLPDSLQDVSNLGQGFVLLGNYPAIHGNRKFAVVAVDHFDRDAGFVAEACRHTGGVLANRASDGALSNRHVFHGCFSFLKRSPSEDGWFRSTVLRRDTNGMCRQVTKLPPQQGPPSRRSTARHVPTTDPSTPKDIKSILLEYYS